MTWNDAITDALTAQAARTDLANGASNLNTVSIIGLAFGGILACVSAGFIEYTGDEGLDPNIYFGTYAGLICLLLLASIFMSNELEPEVILHQREKEKERIRLQESGNGGENDITFDSTEEGEVNEPLCNSCSRTLG
jgi:hypothetical protein